MTLPGIAFTTQLLIVNCITTLPPSPPPFSWDKIPLFMHAGNESGPLNETAAKYMSRFPLATIEKMQDQYANPICTLNSTKACEEDRIIAALKQIRKYSQDTRTIFYLNSLLNFPQYNLSAQLFANEKYLLHDQNGKLVWYSQCANGPNTTVFDLSQNETITMWLNTIEYAMTAEPGVVDGAFVDRGNTNMSSYAHCIDISKQKMEQWNQGHIYMLEQTQKLISSINKERGILIVNNADINGANARMFENYRYNDTWSVNGVTNDLINVMNEKGKRISEVHGDKANYGGFIYNQTVAAYLIAAYEYSYYACTNGWTLQSGWDKMWENTDYNKALGVPVGDAVYNNVTKVYYREFKSGTKVWIDLEWNYPCVKWSDGTITGNATDCAKY
eukprot:504818_1